MLYLVRSRYSQFELAKKHPFEPTKIIVELHTVHHAIKWFAAAKLLKILAFRGLSVPVRRQYRYNVASRLHDLVQSLFLRHPEEHPDVSFLRFSPYLAEGRLRPVSETDPDVAKPVYQPSPDQVSEDARMLRYAFGCLQDGFNRDFLE